MPARLSDRPVRDAVILTPNTLPRPPGERERLAAAWRTPSGWRFLTTVNNSNIGRLYLATALLFFVFGGLLALAMRAQLAVPENTLVGAAHAAAGRARALDAADITITAHMWWWEVRYRDPGAVDGRYIVAANELWIPVGRPVRVALETRDVIHSFWVPQLAGKVDMVPGRITHVTLAADRAGIFRGQCAEFCGTAHARMALHVVAASPEQFAAWRAAQALPAAPGQDEQAQRGQALFLASGCSGCHAIRGLAQSAAADRGPDLTHVASRGWLAAGTLPNDTAALRHWLAATQHLKPGARMPAFEHLAPRDLDALAAFLAQLH